MTLLDGLGALGELTHRRGDPLDALRTVAKNLLVTPEPISSPSPPTEGDEVRLGDGYRMTIRLSELHVDPSYQRPPDRDKVDAIASSGKGLDPILVNCRPEYSFYVLDGQHRALAALARGDSEIECHVIHVPTEDEAHYCNVTNHRPEEG